VPAQVNALSSAKTALPIEYYSLPFCKPNLVDASVLDLGEVLRGDRIFNSLYQMQMRLSEHCKVTCKLDDLSKGDVRILRDKIEKEYRVSAPALVPH
jgi:transmembrane 9 superfamily protein 2/4